MKILFLSKFFMPFDRGGSEWSVHDLAYLLVSRGHRVTVITPNYGAKSTDVIDGIKILRISFPIKIKNTKSQVTPFWTNNVIWFIYSTIFCIYICLKNNYQIIHAQNNEFIPAASIAGKILGKKTVVTFRDYQAICNLGFCLWNSNMACTIGKYLNYDFPFFYQNYVSKKNIVKKYLLLIAAVRAWVMQKIIYLFARNIDYKVAVSTKVKTVFEINGFSNLHVIHNAVIVNKKPKGTDGNKVIYVGKLSIGKGVDIFAKSLKKAEQKLKDVTYEIIGSGHFKKTLKDLVKSEDLVSKVNFIDHLSHNEVLTKVSNAQLVVVPSVWPEPLPRVAIETILSGTPVVATYNGGIREIVKDKYGILTNANENDLAIAIISAYQNKEKFRKNIRDDIRTLNNHFTIKTVKDYEKIYEGH